VQWEGDVLGKLEGVAKENLSKTLFDKTDGLAVKFRDGPAQPFLLSGKWGYSANKAYEKSVFETSVPFRSDFLKFLNAKHVTQVAERLPSYAVPMETVPIAVNADAIVKPLGNVVTLQCADGDLVLYNYNYPDSRTFNWAPDKCGTTSVRVIFPDNLMLYKAYQGASGFPNFLKDFENGTRTFKPDDFPEKKSALARNGVKWIKVTYKIQNGVAVINTLKKPAGVQVPSLITTYSPRN
jgi:type VI secretion system protein ImpL